MSAEAQFLQSRQARRLVTSNQQEERQSRTDVLHTFWAALKGRLNRWKERLEALQTKYSSNNLEKVMTMTEERKRTLRMELCQLEEELRYWKKLCLVADTPADATAMSIRNTDNNNNEDDEDDFLALCPPDLPLSDVRLLHTHFSECQTRLDQVRKSLLPRGKFVFRRYREAVLRQQQQQAYSTETSYGAPKRASTGPSSTSTTNMIKKERHEYDDPGRTISNQKHVRLLVHTDGRVERLDHANEERTQTHQQLARPLSSLLLKNLEHCEITINGHYQSLHLVSVLSSQVRLLHKVEGAIHVTNCHHSSLWSQSQQLRLHDSTYLECHVQVVSVAGAILEDCTELVFYRCRSNNSSCSSNDNNAATMDIKDFNWLKKGIPSPNFRVEVEDEEDYDKTRMPPLLSWQHEPFPATGQPISRDTAGSHSSRAMTDSSPPLVDNSHPLHENNKEDDDDDDEL